MISKFYVDIDQLNVYSNFLKKSMVDINQQITLISRAQHRFESSFKSKLNKPIGDHIRKLKKIFDNFSIEIDSMAKKVKEDYEKYQRFNNSLK